MTSSPTGGPLFTTGFANQHKFYGWGLATTTDPSTGLIYIPSGFQAPGTSDAAMMEYRPTHKYVATIAMPTGAQNTEAYTFTWIPSAKKFFLFGGFINSKAISDMFAFDPATKAWEQIVASGEAPSPRGYHCAVSAEGGAKLMVFAGVPTYGLVTTLGSIHVLDVATRTWTADPEAGQGLERAFPACAASGDIVVSWDGVTSGGTGVTNAMLVFNVEAMSWQSRYDPDGNDER